MHNCVVFIVTALVATNILAADKKNAKDFDANKDDRLSFDEFTKFQIATRDPKFSELDADKDGEITRKEKEKWARDFWWDVESEASSQGVPLKSVATTIPKEKPKAWSLGPLKLRKDHDALIKDLDKADPATLSFYRDNLTSEDTWAVEGTLGAVFDIYNRKDPGEIGNYMLDPIRLVPSVTLNRITGKGPGNLQVTDSLVFRVGASLSLQTTDAARSLWDYQTFSLAYRNSGDTHGGKFTSAGELEWEPMRNRIGDMISISGPEQPPAFWPNAPFFYRLTMNGRLEFGDSPIATDSGGFVKLGPKVGLTITPKSFTALQFFVNYIYLWEIANNGADFDLLEVGARLALDPNKQFFLEGKYRLGQIPAKYTDIDLVQVSLAVKF